MGIGLHRVLTPCLRKEIKSKMTSFYHHVVGNFGLDKQTFAAHQKSIPPSKTLLNYVSINNNNIHRNPRHYDYCVKDEVSLAKLFMKPFMAHFNAFDHSFDSSAALAVLCGASPFISVKGKADDVRSQVRNNWAHCDFTIWTEGHYHTCFDLMEALVTNLGILPADEKRTIGELELWRNQGLEICLLKTLDSTLLQDICKEIQQLSDSLDDYKEEQRTQIRRTLDVFRTEFDSAIAALEEKQNALEKRCEELKCNQDVIREEMSTMDKDHEMHWETTQGVMGLCKTLEAKSLFMQGDLDQIMATLKRMQPSEDVSQVVFDAPEQSKWFTGREHELKSLEKCLPLEESKELRMAAICGLGGCGKTTLAVQFAWQHKHEHEGGVFWISMEDEKKFENSLSDLSLRLEIQANSFDMMLSKVLLWISKQKRPWLLVVDDVDQLSLSEQMHKVFCGRWKRQASGHILLTTRREPKEVCEAINMELSCCLEVYDFPEDDAKRFLVARTGINSVIEQDVALDELVRELGSLPLALEQAGAHIKALQCSVSKYLEEYKSRRLNLLNQQLAKQSSEYESQSRLAVHTTWLLNFEYVRKSPHGAIASTFVEASAFLAPNEIQEELINSQLLTDADQSGQSCNWLPLMKYHVIETLTKFSLFQRTSSRSLELHRLVQEVIRNRMTMEETSSSLIRAVKILFQAFRDCPSPDRILQYVTVSLQEQPSAHVANPSLFYLWSKLAIHAAELQDHLRVFLDRPNIGRESKAAVLSPEACRVLYENAIHLSVHGHQEDAKESERFSLQILDSCPSDGTTLDPEDLRKRFPHTLPLSQKLQKTILYSSRPPTENQTSASFKETQPKSDSIDQIRLRGNDLFKKDCFKEAVEVYTEALEASQDAKHPDPRLLNNRATAYLKMGNFTEGLQDSEEYIKIMPDCWKGYTRKALALIGLGLRFPALCSAAIAYYHDSDSCRRYEPFRNEFNDLDTNWEVTDCSEALRSSLRRNTKKVILLKNGQYKMADGDCRLTLKNTAMASLRCKSDVTINCTEVTLSGNCHFESINFVVQNEIVVGPNGNAEFHKCTFRNSVSKPVILICGATKFFECEVRNSKGSGIVVSGPNSSAALIKCNISGNGRMENPYSFGIRVFNKGSLLVHKCHIYGNIRGIWIDEGPTVFAAKGGIITDSEIYDNKYEGVVVGGSPVLPVSPVILMSGNKIYHNGMFGFRATLNINDIRFEDNMVFENLWWGVCVHNNSGGLYKGNEICNNKMGGIMVGKQSPGKPSCVVENNFIHDNCGPAFHEGLRPSERDSFPKQLHIFFDRAFESRLQGHGMVSFPNNVLTEFHPNRCFRNDQGQTNFTAATLKQCCVYCFQRDVELKPCKRCMTATYCGRECQKLHWQKHKYTCKATRERNSVDVRLSTDESFSISTTGQGLEPNGPDYAPPPLTDGSRFIVKVQTLEADTTFGNIIDMRGFVSDEQDPNKARIMIYDRSRHVNFITSHKPQLYHLIMGCGMMGVTMTLTKKLYCWAAFKDAKTLRIFTHDFPQVQKW